MSEQARESAWVPNLLRPLLIAAMLACLAAPAVRVLEWTFGDWDGSYFLVFTFLAGLEGILSERLLRKRGIRGWAYLVSRGAELLILLLLLNLAGHLLLGMDHLLADARFWLVEPARFFDLRFLFSSLLLFTPLWLGSLYVARLLIELDVETDRGSPPPDKTSVEYYLWLTQPSPALDLQTTLDQLSEFMMWGGVIQVLASAAIEFLLPTAGGLALPTLLYFALAVAFVSQGRFSVLRAGWLIRSIPVQPNLGRRWLLWALVFFVTLALLALLLPTDYAVGPIRALLGLFSLVLYVLALIAALVPFLLTLLLALLLPNVETPARPDLPTLPPVAAEQIPGSQGQAPAWLSVLGTALFWSIVAAIAGYALLRFLQDRLGPLAEGGGQETTWWGRLLVWLRDLWRKWRAWRQHTQLRLERRRAQRAAQRAAGPGRFRFLSLRRLSPRELIRYFYLSTTRRAAQAGQRRRPGQTPYEYQASLDQRFPDLEPDLAGLTGSFVKARYSRRPVEREDSDAIKPLWQRIKAALRKRRAGGQGVEERDHD